jgi:glycosyltransferase involved in cell wall biosynthesis
MKIIHVPFTFAPDPIGGTEVYVANLARDLGELGVDAVVVAPGETSRAYTLDGLRVRRYAVAKDIANVSILYGSGDRAAASQFAEILDEERPDLLHLHAFTSAVSLRLVRLAKRRSIPVVFTYHTPTASCQRGTLLLWGKEICDGKLEVSRCAACTLNGLGMYRPLAKWIARLSPVVSRCLTGHRLQGDIWTALRMRELISMRHDVFRAMASEVDHIVAVCKWVEQLLVRNDVPAAKISISRHGVRRTTTQHVLPSQSLVGESSHEMRLAFLGRLDPTKGVHILIDALASKPRLKVRLDIYGVVQNAANATYQNAMMKLTRGDPRISFQTPIAPGAVVSHLRGYDFLAVPSQWIETGPMVALEAFAAGIPVIGWNIGGISEIVRDRIDGLLIEPGSDWGEVLSRIAQDANLRAQLKAGVRPPRTSMEVAREMLALYQSLSGSARARLPEQFASISGTNHGQDRPRLPARPN